MTAAYAILHLLVDGMCALAMFGRFLPRGNVAFYILIYNFCAFALQMPLGVVLDRLGGRGGAGQEKSAFSFAAAGVLCTLAGSFAHPAVLGIGNALFHVGGGVGTIREDNLRNWQGRGLGVFVAPGALGLYLGTLAGKAGLRHICAAAIGALMLLLCAWLLWRLKKAGDAEGRCACSGHAGGENSLPGDRRGERMTEGFGAVSICCLLVVILRSYVGMAVSFPWKSGTLAGILAVLAVVGGKIVGGFGAAGYGFLRASLVSLGLSAACFLFSDFLPLGLAALFLFNMTMPVTLYWMVRNIPQMPGSAFGFLTFALFLGFLPVYFGLIPGAGGNLLGCAGSVLSLLLLAAGYGWTHGWWKRWGLSDKNGEAGSWRNKNRAAIERQQQKNGAGAAEEP